MTSSSKKRKKKRADFQKVKLKVGRRLPKGQNVTDTKFQTHKIQIREQLTKDLSTQYVKRKVKIEDLLNALNHHNTTSRQNALSSLKELLSSEEELIGKHLSNIMQSISKLIEDKMGDIRKGAQAVLKLVLAKGTRSQLSTVFPLLGAYLCCGMTHIEQDIQHDSLIFLDIILEHAPELLVDINPQILSNFLEQISRKSQAPSKSTANHGRTLLINPDRKCTGHTWRLQVLKRVEKFLSTTLNHMKTKGKGKFHKTLEIHWTSKPVVKLIPHPASTSQNNFPFGGVNMMKTVLNQQPKNLLEDENELKNFISSLMPLLLETWVEASPVQYVRNVPGNCLPVEAFETLTSVVEIMKLLLDCVYAHTNYDSRVTLKQWCKDLFEKQFLDYFMKNFPYVYQETAKKVRFAINGITVQAQCCSLNLSICNIFTKIVSSLTDETQKYANNIVNYLGLLFESPDSKFSTINAKSMIEVFKAVLQSSQFADKTEKLLDVALSSYQNDNAVKKRKAIVFDLFSSIVLEPSHTNLSSNALTRWLMLLPKELDNLQMKIGVINVIHKLAPQNCEVLLSSMQLQKTNIIELIPQILGEDGENSEAQNTLVELLLYMRYLEKSDYQMLTQHVRNQALKIELRLYCMEVLNLRYHRCNSYYRSLETANYTSFLMGVALGFSNIEIENFKMLGEESLPVFVNITSAAWEPSAWSSHQKIVDRVTNCFSDFENLDQAETVFWAYVEKYLQSCQTYPLEVSWSILRVVSTLKLKVDKLEKFSELLVATIYAEVLSGHDDRTIAWCCEQEQITDNIIAAFAKISQDVGSELAANAICIIFAKILQRFTPNTQLLQVMKDAIGMLKFKLGDKHKDSAAWHSFVYEFSLKSDLQE